MEWSISFPGWGPDAGLRFDQDLLLLRRRVGLLLGRGGAEWAGRIEALCRRDLGWDALRWQQEWQRYRSIHAGHYSLPQPDRNQE